MTVNLYDLVTSQMSLKARILAGCALVEPTRVLDSMNGLLFSDLTDVNARTFMVELANSRAQLEGLDLEATAEFTCGIAINCGLLEDCNRWLAEACWQAEPSTALAVQTTKEIQALKTTLSTLGVLGKLAKEVSDR